MKAFSDMLTQFAQYISEAVMRIFAPNDDAYPLIGVQPFTGEPFKRRAADIW
ncbi:MAG: hypothetical protein SAK29_09780 [Scytonema sp. PMC 1069.18]|nr:hypothetical protein [Scytonema sp. PMC 1069.18]MEC4882713.1 hypothetical protein [Scytonema sp. PMC 1070.18]